MKKRIIARVIITLILFWAHCGAVAIYQLFESPIKGTAGAQLATDSVEAYGWFKFIASDSIPKTISIVTLFLLCFVWLTLLRKQKPTIKNNEK